MLTTNDYQHTVEIEDLDDVVTYDDLIEDELDAIFTQLEAEWAATKAHNESPEVI